MLRHLAFFIFPPFAAWSQPGIYAQLHFSFPGFDLIDTLKSAPGFGVYGFVPLKTEKATLEFYPGYIQQSFRSSDELTRYTNRFVEVKCMYVFESLGLGLGLSPSLFLSSLRFDPGSQNQSGLVRKELPVTQRLNVGLETSYNMKMNEKMYLRISANGSAIPSKGSTITGMLPALNIGLRYQLKKNNPDESENAQSYELKPFRDLYVSLPSKLPEDMSRSRVGSVQFDSIIIKAFTNAYQGNIIFIRDTSLAYLPSQVSTIHSKKGMEWSDSGYAVAYVGDYFSSGSRASGAGIYLLDGNLSLVTEPFHGYYRIATGGLNEAILEQRLIKAVTLLNRQVMGLQSQNQKP